MVIYSFLPSLI
jgi:hypothetical protein